MIALAFTPYLTRETVSFGIAVSEEYYRSEPLRQMRKKYAVTSIAINMVLLIIALYSLMQVNEFTQGIIISVCIVLMVACSFMMNVTFHLKMKTMKASLPIGKVHKAVVTVDTSFRHQKLIFSNKWFLIHGLIIAISVIAVFMNYDRIPDLIPMHYDLQGNVTNSVAKSYRTILFPNVMQILMTLLFVFINWTILKSKQQIHSGDPERSIRQNTIFRRRWSLFTILTGFVLVLLFAFMQFNMVNPLDNTLNMFISILVPCFIVIFALILSFTTGQGGSRIDRPAEASGTQPINDDDNWKFGIIYFNPRDPSIFVEKRIGVGWTVNFGHPLGWIILIGIIAVIVLSSIYLD